MLTSPSSLVSSSNKSTSPNKSIEERALALLSQGIDHNIVANAIGVSPGRISQLLSEEVFSTKLVELTYNSLIDASTRDKKYDSLEDKLIAKLESCLESMYKPFEIMRALQTINSAKRRGSLSPENLLPKTAETVSLNLPTHLMTIFAPGSQVNVQVNIHNQVIKAGDQELITMQSGNIDGLAKTLKSPPLTPLIQRKEIHDVCPPKLPPPEVKSNAQSISQTS